MFILFWLIRILAANRWHTQVIESNLIEETVYKGVGKIKGANSGWVKHPETGHRGNCYHPEIWSSQRENLVRTVCSGPRRCPTERQTYTEK